MKKSNFMRPLIHIFLHVSIAAEIVSLLNLKTFLHLPVSELPTWFYIMQVIYSAYVITLLPDRKFIPFGILMGLSLINYAMGDSWMLWMQAVDASICLLTLLWLLGEECMDMMRYNESKDSMNNFTVYQYKRQE